MLPAPFRMRSSRQFAWTIRNGVRAGRPSVVVHASRHDPDADRGQPLVGFVVSKQIGNAVTRNRVKRRLRSLASTQLHGTPSGVSLVIRALPPAAQAGAQLADDLDGAWQQALRRLEVA